jgi:hypothetical protein
VSSRCPISEQVLHVNHSPYGSLDEPEDCEQFFAKANIQYSVPDIEVYPYVKKNNSHNQKGTELAYKAVFHQIA